MAVVRRSSHRNGEMGIGASKATAEQAEPKARSGASLGEYVALFALVLPAVGYAAAYNFRVGEAQHFGLPVELVSLEVKDAVVGGLGVAVALALVLGLINIVMDLLEGVFSNDIQREVSNVAVPLTAAGAILYLWGQPPWAWLGLLVAGVVLILIHFGMPLITQRRVHGYEAKLKAQREMESAIRPSPLVRFIRGRRELFLAVAAIYIALYVAGPAGAFSARGRTSYAVIKTTPERIVVAEYRGLLVTMGFDRKTATAAPPINVIRAEDVKQGFFVERTGSVTFVKP